MYKKVEVLPASGVFPTQVCIDSHPCIPLYCPWTINTGWWRADISSVQTGSSVLKRQRWGQGQTWWQKSADGGQYVTWVWNMTAGGRPCCTFLVALLIHHKQILPTESTCMLGCIQTYKYAHLHAAMRCIVLLRILTDPRETKAQFVLSDLKDLQHMWPFDPAHGTFARFRKAACERE